MAHLILHKLFYPLRYLRAISSLALFNERRTNLRVGKKSLNGFKKSKKNRTNSRKCNRNISLKEISSSIILRDVFALLTLSPRDGNKSIVTEKEFSRGFLHPVSDSRVEKYPKELPFQSVVIGNNVSLKNYSTPYHLYGTSDPNISHGRALGWPLHSIPLDFFQLIRLVRVGASTRKEVIFLFKDNKATGLTHVSDF